MNKKFTLTGICMAVVFLLSTSFFAKAQTTITTTFTNNNGFGLVTFNFTNGNAGPVMITDIVSVAGTAGASNATLFYKTTSINGSPGAISAANGWQTAATGAYTAVSNTTTTASQTMLTGMTFQIPAGATYGFAFQSALATGAGNLRYSSIAAGTQTLTGGGCSFITGDNVGYAGDVSPATPPNSPRGFIGSITFSNVSTTPCAGTPNPGNTISSAASVCSGTPFTLSLQNQTAGTGVTYVWQSASSTTGPFTTIPGATSNTYFVAAGITATTYYHAIVSCAGNPTTSNNVTVALTPASGCYCASNATSAVDEDIFNVTLSNMSNTSTCTSVVTGANSVINQYSNYTSGTTAVTAPTIFQGATMPMSVTIGTCGGNFNNSTAVWIDFDQSGSFSAAERVYVSAAATSGPHTESFNIVIPAGATLGTTRMRVVTVETATPTSIVACGTYNWGETEDYNVTIAACVPATVTTQPPAAVSAVCGSNATITATIGGSLPSYQWQVRTTPAGVWLNLTNAAPYSGVTTNTLTITGVTPAMNNYAYRLIYSNGCAGQSPTSVTTLTVTAAAPTFTQTPAALCAGGSTAQLITVTGGGTGVFTPVAGLYTDAAHLIAYTGTAVTSVYAFPTAAGQYSATYSLVTTNGPCVSSAGNVIVVANLPLSGTATLPAATAICANAAGTISVTGLTGGGLTYQWQISTVAVPAFTNLANGGVYSGATSANLVITNPVATMTGNQYRVIVTSASCGTNATSNATTLTVNPVPVVVINVSPNTTVAPSQPNSVTLTAAVSSATSPIHYQWFRNGAAIPGANSIRYIVPGNGAGFYSVVVTDANGCATGTSSPISITVTAKPTDNLFIYPSPNNGTFQVRYYNGTATSTATEYAWVNVYDAKGTRVYTQRYALNGAYTRMNVVMNVHGKGIYRVDLVDNTGVRLQTGSVFIF